MGKQQNQVPQIHIVLGKLDLLAPYVARSFGSKCEYISNGSFAYAACVPERNCFRKGMSYNKNDQSSQHNSFLKNFMTKKQAVVVITYP